MPSAKTLRDLLLIRESNRKLLDDLNGPWGTALGKNRAGDPAILVFVDRKIHGNWLGEISVVPPSLDEPNGLTCPTDVLQVGGDLQTPYAPSRLSGQQLVLRNRLRGESERMSPGSQLTFQDLDGQVYSGTLGAFARRRDTGAVGLITNAHIGSHEGNLLTHPDLKSKVIARITRMVRAVPVSQRYGGIIKDQEARVMMDCAFAELVGVDLVGQLEYRVPWIRDDAGTETIAFAPIGSIRQINLDDPSLFPVNQSVYAVGRTRSEQRGIVRAYAYQSADGPYVATYTDLLVSSNDEEDFFSYAGDSGKMIFSDDDDSRPVGLLWGGTNLRTNVARELVDHSMAIDIQAVVDALDVDILEAAPTPP